MGQRLAVRQIIDRLDLKIASIESGAQDIPTNSTKSVDADFYHTVLLCYPLSLKLGLESEWRKRH
jgi:hypothetical protein